INTLQSVDFSEEYSFVAAIPNKELRYRTLEGYIYPDTYEFYIGENASSVVRRFLDNFESRWTTEYQKRADEMGVSVDEIITMASILQGEAASADQMEDISSVLYNRLNRSSAFPWLQCDSTEDYLLKTIKPSLTSSTEDTEKYIRYRDNYDTYSTECTGLPVGAICNPGNSAIKAALYPSDTDYFYFRHDDKGNVYYASSLAEHEANGRKIADD
ncbi:MAG: endolytic transglycosylase MltG, partial [Oscillospiraceae bacterium]|nr:endolytic transglycosylase MltG [Oscillospiraceae bacterium]